MSLHDDYSNVKAGDTVYIESVLSKVRVPVLVHKVTKTMITVSNDRRYSKIDGEILPRSKFPTHWLRVSKE